MKMEEKQLNIILSALADKIRDLTWANDSLTYENKRLKEQLQNLRESQTNIIKIDEVRNGK